MVGNKYTPLVVVVAQVQVIAEVEVDLVHQLDTRLIAQGFADKAATGGGYGLYRLGRLPSVQPPQAAGNHYLVGGSWAQHGGQEMRYAVCRRDSRNAHGSQVLGAAQLGPHADVGPDAVSQ